MKHTKKGKLGFPYCIPRIGQLYIDLLSNGVGTGCGSRPFTVKTSHGGMEIR